MKIIDNSECLIGFGNFVKEGREKLHLHQSDAATLIGISQPYFSQIERGGRNVDLVLAIKICNSLNLDLNDYIKRFLE
jgi:transcriptional regulator with XRE-family HTH domain